ncbi:MAG: PH domain-containing protein [Gemmatimonadaceae bacterium]|nr:PH domain-containing protein [Gemmatimonadaceae bacterium]
MAESVEHVGPDGEVRRLPAGERVLWQGAPDRRSLARFLLRERWLLAFVAFSFALGAAEALQHAEGAGARLVGVATLSAVMAAIAIVAVRIFAWLLQRTSKYVITDRRLYFNIGIVLRADANVPYTSIEGVDLLRHKDGSADLMVTLGESQEIPWLLLFPHMSWRGAKRGRPTFRGLRDADAAATAVVGALRACTAGGADAGATGATANAAPVAARTHLTAATPSPA